MLHCDEVTRLCASEDLRRAPLGKRLAVRFHLMMCRSCQRYVQELKAIGGAVRDLGRERSDDEERTESILRRVLQEEGDPNP